MPDAEVQAIREEIAAISTLVATVIEQLPDDVLSEVVDIPAKNVKGSGNA